MRSSDRLRGVVALFGTLAYAVPAQATPTFPQTVATHLGASRVPDCSVCHVGSQQRGTANTPFGSEMRSRGVVAYDEASLTEALDQMENARIDSDGDAIIDVDELRLGSDPNNAPGASTFTPTYGCGVSRDAQVGGSNGFPFLLGLAVWLSSSGLRGRATNRRRSSRPSR